MSDYRPGQILDITLHGVEVHGPGGPGYLIVDLPKGPQLTLPVNHPSVSVERVASPDYPPRRDALADVLHLLREDYQTCRAAVAVLRRPTPTGQDPEWSVAHRVLCAVAEHIATRKAGEQ